MKKTIIITLFASLLSISLFAQESATEELSAAELFNAGNEAYKTKDYTKALENWEAYLNHPDSDPVNTESCTYNCAKVAKKTGKIEKARTYYQKCIDLDYKSDLATFQLGQTYKEEDSDKYMELMEKCVTEYPNSKYYKKYFLPSVTNYYNKVAAEVFNEANAAAQEATASGDAYKYVEMMEANVLPLFDKAEEAFNKTLSFDDTDTKATNAITNINTQRETFVAYKTELEAQKK